MIIYQIKQAIQEPIFVIRPREWGGICCL